LEKLGNTNVAAADMLDWLRATESCKSAKAVWGGRFKSNDNYSKAELTSWIGDVEKQMALDNYAASKALKSSSSKSHKKRK